MKVQQRVVNKCLIVAPAGFLDASDAPEFRSVVAVAMEKTHAKHLLVDCVDLQMITSSGLQVLLVTMRMAREKGGRAALCRVNPPIREVLKITRLDQFFDFHEDESAAAALFTD